MSNYGSIKIRNNKLIQLELFCELHGIIAGRTYLFKLSSVPVSFLQRRAMSSSFIGSSLMKLQ